jgi:transposase
MKNITKRDQKELEKRRLQAGKMFEKGISQVSISKKFKVSRAAVCQWYAMWKEDGKKGLQSRGLPGFDSEFTEEKKKKLKTIILAGPIKSGYVTDFWTINRVRAVTKKELLIDLGYTRIWNTVLSLGFSCQKPERRARERNEKSITDWKQNTFPRLKKMGSKTSFYNRISG